MFNNFISIGRPVEEGLGGGVFLERVVSLGWALRFQKSIPFPVI